MSSIWLGFVIYRCTYSSDTDWEACIRIIRRQFERILGICSATDLLGSNPFTIFDDQSVFDEATTDSVRQHFDKWTTTAPTAEQGTTGPGPYGGTPRYTLCLQIDERSLRSIVDDDAELFFDSKGYVKLIRRAWQPKSEERLEEEAALQERSSVERFDALEGCTQHDVGWMKISHVELISWCNLYSQMQNVWDTHYKRPPALVRY
jgi:hypothetical protein